jgi:hypothetical protein
MYVCVCMTVIEFYYFSRTRFMEVGRVTQSV